VFVLHKKRDFAELKKLLLPWISVRILLSPSLLHLQGTRTKHTGKNLFEALL
jgi:hypothetical protein